MSDRIFGVACIALAGFFIWRATLIESSFIMDPLGPKAFPFVIAGVLALAGLYPIFFPDPRPDWPAAGRVLEIGVAIVIMVAYALVLPRLGFVLSTAIAAGLLSWRLGARPLEAAAAGVALAIGIYAIFHLALGLTLARGPWGF